MNDKIIKIMPLGDSMTDGFVSIGGYRNILEKLIKDSGYSENIKFCGSMQSGGVFDGRHEGHSGWAIDEIKPDEDIEKKGRFGLMMHIDEWINAVSPDIVMLQIGTNDILSQYKLSRAGERLNKLLDCVENGMNKDGTIYIAKIPYIDVKADFNQTGITDQKVMDKMIDSYNEDVVRTARERGYKVVDINRILSISDLCDGVHPSEDGYMKMGELWFNEIEKEINKRIQQKFQHREE